MERSQHPVRDECPLFCTRVHARLVSAASAKTQADRALHSSTLPALALLASSLVLVSLRCPACLSHCQLISAAAIWLRQPQRAQASTTRTRPLSRLAQPLTLAQAAEKEERKK